MEQIKVYVHGFRTTKASKTGPDVRRRGFVHVYIFKGDERLHALHFKAGTSTDECNYLAIKFGLKWLQKHSTEWDSAIVASSSEEAVKALLGGKEYKRLKGIPAEISQLLTSLGKVVLVVFPIPKVESKLVAFTPT